MSQKTSSPFALASFPVQVSYPVVLLIAICSLHSGAAAADKPNIVLLLADDLGYADVGCYGCPDIRTPHIDGLAKQGLRLTNFYSNGPECSPTRTALLTGRYQQR